MSNPQTAGAPGRPVWMFMAATAMATTVSTMAATAMVKAEATEPVTVTCDCATPAAAVVPAPAVAPAPAPAEQAAEPDQPITAPEPEQAEPEPPTTKVEGALDREVIRRVVRAHINEVRYCYNEGLAGDPELAGRVVIEFVVGSEGKVTRSTVESTDLEGDVPDCIAKAVGRWMFPRPADHQDVMITYPFVLEPG